MTSGMINLRIMTVIDELMIGTLHLTFFSLKPFIEEKKPKKMTVRWEEKKGI